MNHHIEFIMCVFGAALLSQGITRAYPEGAPEEVCDSMYPGHQSRKDPSEIVKPQTGKPYFSIQVDKVKVDVNDDVYVTIVTNEYYFEGFLIQARDVDEQAPSDSSTVKKYGTFTVTSNNKSQVLCDAQAVTHAVHEHFQNVTVKWTSPNMTVENIQFKATVVKGYETFFMNVRSEILNHSGTISCIPSIILTAFMFCFINIHWSL